MPAQTLLGGTSHPGMAGSPGDGMAGSGSLPDGGNVKLRAAPVAARCGAAGFIRDRCMNPEFGVTVGEMTVVWNMDLERQLEPIGGLHDIRFIHLRAGDLQAR